MLVKMFKMVVNMEEKKCRCRNSDCLEGRERERAGEDKRNAMITACSLAWEFEPHALEHDISSITSSHTHNF